MSKLELLIADAENLEMKAEQDKLDAIAAQCEAARAAVTAAFDGLWDELEPHADAGNTWTADGQVTTWWTTVQAPGLVTFSAVVRFDRGHITLPYLIALDRPEPGYPKHVFRDLPQFLLECKRAADEQALKVTTKRLGELRVKLEGYDNLRVATLAEADAVLAELTALDPTGVEAWNKLHAEWHMWHNRKVEEAREDKAAKYRQAVLAAEYEAAYRIYYAARQETLATNAARLDEFQKGLDSPFPTWELTYGVTGENEDGEFIADTRSVHVLADSPDGNGYWVTLNGRGVVVKKFYNLVALAALVERRPTADGDMCARIVVSAPNNRYWRTIYFHPTGDGERIFARALELLEPWPVRPEPPEDLTGNVAESIRRKIVGEATGDYDVDMRF